MFLPLFLCTYAVCPAAWRNVTLLIGSWLFYGWLSPRFLAVHVMLTITAWVGGLLIDAWRQESKGRVRILVALIVLNTAMLCWYKYANIVAGTLNEAMVWSGAAPLSWQRVIMPAGLSFVVLQAISYLVDVHRRTVPVERSFIHYATYISMFGHSVAGPIIRYDWVRRELHRRSFNAQNFFAGCTPVHGRDVYEGTGGRHPVARRRRGVQCADPQFFSDAWLGCLAYSLQLFFDFAGYSSMAIGLGLMLGFHFPENFNHPYLANSIQDFWRRWHMSLSSWLRDYLYIPLGGNRHGPWKTYRNLFLIMAIAGLWHGGDNWNYLLWGCAHGIALCVDRAWNRSSLPPCTSRALPWADTAVRLPGMDTVPRP
ncbi:MBOAT family O-acyltransferase [Pseudomonas lini]